MKQVKLVVGVFLLVGLMAMPAFASGNITVVGASNVAHEIMGQDRYANVTTVSMILGNALPSGAIINMSLTGSAIFTGAYYLCASNTLGSNNSTIAVANPSSNTTISFVHSPIPVSNVAPNAVIWMSSNVTCIPDGNVLFRLPSGSATGVSALSGNVQWVATDVTARDTFGANNVVTVINEFGTTLSTADLVSIDYLAGPANGTTIVAQGATNLIAMSTSKITQIRNTSAASSNSTAGVGGAFNQVLTLSDSAGWAGVNRVYIVGGATTSCTTSTVIASQSTPSGNVTLTYPNAANTAAAINTTLCVQVQGTAALSSRTISGSYSYAAMTGSGLLAPTGGGAAAWQSWIPNGYQAFNPYMYMGADQTVDVFNRFYNNYTATARVFVEVFPSDGSATTTYTLASILPNEAGTYWGSDIGALAGLTVGTSYAARFSVTAPQDKVNGVSFYKRTSNGDRQLPLYKATGTPGNYLVE